MELVNEFRVPVPADQAWAVLTDVERIAPCLPGAQLLTVDGDQFTGAVKVKVGPITVQYKGKAAFEQKDESARRAVIKASGKETRGQGNAAAVVTAQLKDDGDTTTCVLSTDLTISGKAAQFGRGVLADVATKLIQQFADRLEADVLSTGTAAPQSIGGMSPETPDTTATAPAAQYAAQSTAHSPTQSDASLDLLSVLAVPVAKRVLPAAAGLAAGVAIGWLLARRRSA
ncbi:MAG: SRPBCC family protein [Mycobacteriaceae bacterium]|nr:SRPBCC family protein [Mycobacteriaceae bacterium]